MKAMTLLHAQPYDLDAQGFYFESAEDYAAQVRNLRNRWNEPVEEFEIQFIDGDGIDAELFHALRVSQGDVEPFFEALTEWTYDDKTRVIIAVGEVGTPFSLGKDDPVDLDIDLYEVESLRELAVQLVEEGLFGEIPDAISCYLDYDAIARDLAMDYGSVAIDGRRYAYRSP
jgi:Antirestriction protein (ArdA)